MHPQDFLQALFAFQKIVFDLGIETRWTKFLIFSGCFVVHVTPPVLVPAPER
jgi:hypothetical protein